MAEERPKIRPSEQILPGALGNPTANPLVSSRMNSLPISDVFEIPLDDVPTDGMMNPENLKMIQDATIANQFFLPSGGGTSVTKDSKLGFDLSDPISSVRRNNVKLDPVQAQIKLPTYFSAADTGFDRYYAHPKFAEIGFTPYNPNTEEIYNSNSSLSDDMTRMGSEFSGLFGNAFMSGYRAIGDVFTGEYGDPDFEGAMAFENAMRVGNSTRDGLGAKGSNFLLNSAYTFGIIGSIAAEELALAMGSAALTATGVGAPTGIGAFLAGTARNLYRSGKAIKDTFAIGRMASATSDMIRGFNSVSKAKNFFQAVKLGKQPVAKFFMPGTMRALRDLNSTKVAAQGLGNIGKGAIAFGGFYRDVRALNLAIAEGKMESGITYNEQYENAVNIMQKKLGRELTQKELYAANANAAQAGFRTLQYNAPFIFLTNQIVLRRSLSGFGGKFGRIFDEGMSNLGRRILRTKPLRDAAGKASKDVYEDVGKGFLGLPSLKRIKNWTIGGTARTGAHGALRYFAANISEGVQEVYQEAVNVGTQDYFSELLEHSSAEDGMARWGGINESFFGGLDQINMGTGIKSQMSAQGFETFMSGFLMGGLVQGPQKFVFGFIPNQFNRVTKPEEYAEFQKQKEKYIGELVNTWNTQSEQMLNDPDANFNENKLRFAAIHQAEKEMDSYNYEGDPLGYYDSKDFLQFQNYARLFDNGAHIHYTQALRDFTQLSDEELAEAFPEQKEDALNGKLRTRFTDQIARINKMQSRFEKHRYDYQNKYDPKRFEQNTREYYSELVKYRAFEHARFLYLFTENGFERALERSNQIYSELASEPLLEGIEANDLQAIADAPSIQNEINLLQQEIDTLKNTKGNKRSEIAAKKRKVKALENYYNVFTAKENQIKDGSRYSRTPANVKKLRAALLDYVNTIAEERGDFVNTKSVDSALKKLIDYGELKQRTRTYDKAIQILADPKMLDNLAERMEPIMENMFNNSKKLFKKLIRQKIAKTERTETLKALDKLGVLVPPGEAMDFLISGDVSKLKSFENRKGAVREESDAELFQAIQEVLLKYEKLVTPEEVKEEVEQDSQDFENAKATQEQNFEDAEESGSPLPSINTELISDQESAILNALYKKYKQSVIAGPAENILTEDEWLELNSTKSKYNGIQKIFALYKADISKETDPETELSFEQWFGQNRNSKNIRLLLLTNKLNSSDFVEGEKGVAPANLPPNQKFMKKHKGVNILRIKLNVEGVERTVYRIVDNDLQPVAASLYQRAGLDNIDTHNSIGSADKVFNTLKQFISEDTNYNFDGIDLGYGDTIIDIETGQKYFVIGTPNTLVDGAKLKVRRLADGKEILVSEVGFAETYKKDDRKFKEKITRPEKTKITRIKTGELNSIYPDRTKPNGIYEMIDDPDFNINNVTFTISLNPERTEKPFTIRGDSRTPNPYVKVLGDKYLVAVNYNGNRVGFVANGQYKFEFEGKSLDLSSSQDSLQFVFDMNKADIVNQVVSARHLEATLDKLYKGSSGAIEVTMGQFQKEKINFNIKGDTFNYDSQPQSLNELSNSIDTSFEGGQLIIIRRKNKDDEGNIVVTTDYVSSLEKGAQEQYEKALAEIQKDKALINQLVRKGYTAVTRRSNGDILLIPLDINQSQNFNELLVQIAEASINLSVDNIDDKGNVKDPAGSKKINATIKTSVFITGKPGDKLTLSLNAKGDVILQGKQNGKSVNVLVTAAEYAEKGFKQVIEKFNEKGKISNKNFSTFIPKEATVNEIINATTTTIQITRPKPNRTMFFNVDSEQLGADELINTPQPKDQNTKTNDKVDLGKISEMSQKSDTVAPTDQLTEEVNKAIEARDALKKQIYREARKEGKNRGAALKESAEYKKAVNKVNELIKKLGDTAYKVLPQEFQGVETEKIDAFITWTNENLPEFVNVGNVNDIGNRLKTNGITAGAFIMALNDIAGKVDIKGTIYVGTHGFRYHEAFHAVFRMLLTTEEQKVYLDIAKKEVKAKFRKEGKNFEAELEKFKNLSALYKSFNRARLEQEFYEEYIADEFEKFKQGPKNSTAGGFIKSLFTRILNWIKTVLGGFTKNQLKPLFENIDSGKYKSRGIANNMFTDSMTQGITVDAYKLLPIAEIAGQRQITYKYLDPNTATFLVNSFVARVVKLSDTSKSLSEIEDQVFDEFADLYDSTNARYNNLTDLQFDRLLEIEKALDFMSDTRSADSRPKIILEARQMIDTFQLKLDNQADINEVFENDLGLRTTEQWDKDASMVGGVTALPLKLRLYIATTTVEDTDYFGNQFLIDPVMDEKGNILNEGEKLIIPVDIDAVYNGVLKAVKNKTDHYDILSSLYVFGQTNKHTKAFVTRLFNDMGINGDELLESGRLPKIVQRASFAMQVIKSFQNARINYLFIQTDTGTGKNFFYDAATRDAARTQLGSWQQMFDQKLAIIKSDPKFKGRVQGTLKKVIGRLQAKRISLSETKFNSEVSRLSKELFDAVGIKLSSEYLKLSILRSSPENIQTKTKAQQKLLDDNKNVRVLTVDDVSAFKDLILAEKDIYSKQNGAKSKLVSISIGNQSLDEQVGSTVWTDAEGNLVYAHQLPTFHTKIINRLNNEEFFEELAERYPDNPLIKSSAFQALSAENKIQLFRSAGFRKGRMSLSEQNEILGDGTKSLNYAKTFGRQSPEEFITNLVKLYTFNYNTNTEENTVSDTKAVVPTFIRVLEAGNTGDLTNLPVTKTVELVNKKIKIPKEVLDTFVGMVKNEYQRILREIENPTQDLIVGYNADKFGNSTSNTKEGRAYRLFNTSYLLSASSYLSPGSIKLLEQEAYKGTPFTEAAKAIFEVGFYNVVEKSLLDEFNSFYDKVGSVIANDSGFIGTGVKNSDGSVTGEKIKIANAQLNLIPGQYKLNLAQVYFNDKLNTTAINELILGDEALTLKDSVDKVKRGKGQNAAIRSIDFGFTDPQVGITHTLENIEIYPFKDPEYLKQSGEDMQERTDGGIYNTTKGFRYSQYGMGNLTESLVNILDDVQYGEAVPSYNIESYAGRQDALNSKKFVYFNGTTYMKMSNTTLTPEFTSLKDENGLYTIPKPNKVALHNLRVKMEAYEEANDAVVFGAPTSSLKMLKKNIDTADQAFSESGLTSGDLTTVKAEFMGLQMVNPSNKKTITSGTQMRVLLTSEQNDVEDVIIDGVKIPVRKLRKMYNDNISGKIKLGFELKKSLLTNKDGNLDLFSFLKYAIRNLKTAKTTSNIIEQFEVDVNGQMKYGLNSPHMVEKAEGLFLSYFNEVLKDRSPGMSLALMSDYGINIYRRVYEVDANGVPSKFDIIRENVMHRSSSSVDIDISNDNFSDLISALKNNKKGVIVMDRLRSDMADADGLKYSEFIMPAHFKSIYDKYNDTNLALPDFLQKHFGIRIPSQDKHSGLNLRLVDFMPHYMGSTGVFSREILERSGADFDIDKLYTHMKEFYEQDGQFFEYGKNGYKDYMAYVNKMFNSGKPNEFKDALDKYNIGTDRKRSDEALPAVLDILGLPYTEKEYNSYVKEKGEPYAAAYSNKDLDYKYALLGNKAMTEAPAGEIPIVAQEAGLTRLREARKFMEEKVPQWAEDNSEVDVDVNGLLGKYLSYKNNKEGAANIGLAVKPNLVYSLMREYKINLDKKFWFTVNKNSARGFKNNTANERTAILFDELITAMVDNAKERMSAVLGLDRENLPLVSAGIAMGIPLNDLILLLNAPGVKGFDVYFKPEKKPVSITETEILRNYNDKSKKGEVDKMLQVKARLFAISKQAQKIGKVMNLDKGMGRSFSDLIEMSANIEVVEELDTNPLNNSYFQTNVEIFEEITQDILPKIFFRADSAFQFQLSKILKDEISQSLFDVTNTINLEKINKISLDFMSFLLIRKYQDRLLDSSSKSVGSLSNEFIYEGGQGESVIDVVKKLRKLAPQDDYFLNNFLQTVEATDPNSKDGLNKVVSNTFARLSDNQKVKIQNGFAALYGDALTRPDAIKLLHYIMIKDGLQFATGSIMEALSPFVLEHFLDKTQDGIEVTEKLKKEFVDGYFRSPKSQEYLTTVLPDSVKEGKQVEPVDGGVAEERYIISAESGSPLGIRGQEFIVIGRSLFQQQQTNPGELNTDISGNFVYDRVAQMGSVNQNAIGFMFNTPGFQRPSTVVIRDKQENKSSGQPMPDQNELLQLDKLNFDESMDIVADENGFKEKAKEKISNLVKEKTEAREVPLEGKGTINIYYGSSESATNTKVLSNLAKRNFTYQGRSYGSVEHAYQSNKSGQFDQTTYDKYEKIGGFGRKIRGKAVVEGFDNLQLMRNLVVESFAQNPNSAAAAKLKEYSNFTHSTNTIIDKAFLDGIYQAKEQLTTEQGDQLESSMPVAIIENWINTPEGSLANQTPVQSAEKLVVKYLEERGKRIKKYSGLDEFMREVADVPSNVAVEGFFNNLGVAKKLTEYITNVISNTVQGNNISETVEIETEVLPETTSKIKALLKSKAGVNEDVLGNFWNNEVSGSVEIKNKLGYSTYGNMKAQYKKINEGMFPLTEEEFIEQLRCKF